MRKIKFLTTVFMLVSVLSLLLISPIFAEASGETPRYEGLSYAIAGLIVGLAMLYGFYCWGRRFIEFIMDMLKIIFGKKYDNCPNCNFKGDTAVWTCQECGVIFCGECISENHNCPKCNKSNFKDSGAILS